MRSVSRIASPHRFVRIDWLLLFWLVVATIATARTPTAEVTVTASRSSPPPPPPSAPPCANGQPKGDTVACISGHPLSLEELDRSGGHAVQQALEQLYRQRTLALYQRLSDELLTREARSQHVTVDKLLEEKVNAHTTPVTQDAITQFLRDQTGSAAGDPQRTQQATSYLNLKARADAKRQYVEGLFKRYDVHVSLVPPPPAPAEEVRGPEDPSMGPADAPVKVVVFSDYLCPYCRSLSRTLDSLLERYPKDVRVIYRHFPLHPQADRLAQAAQCAQAQGHFATYNRALFERTDITLEALRPLAEDLGMDRAAFSSCLDSERFRTRVEEDLQEGNRLGIGGTPTLFVNGTRLEGNQSLQALSARIEALRHNSRPYPLARTNFLE